VRRRLAWLLMLAFALSAGACFTRSDSRRESRVAASAASDDAKRLTIVAEAGAETRDAGARRLRVRLRPDPAYLSQTGDSPRELSELIEAASHVLTEAVGARLELEHAQPWTHQVDGSLEAAIRALRAEDPGGGCRPGCRNGG